MPVVAVDDVRREAEVRNGVEHGAAEESVLLYLVIAAAVYLIAEVAFTVHKVNYDAVKLQLLNADIFMPPAQIDKEIKKMLHLRGILFLYDPVIRRYHARIYPQPCKRLRQRADNVRKAAGL